MRRELFDTEMKPAVKTASNGVARNGHAADGKFVAGNRAALGRRTRSAWRESFDAACTPDDLAAIVRKAVEQAKKGDRFAREWVGGFCLQRPPRLLDVSMSHELMEPMDPNDPSFHIYD